VLVVGSKDTVAHVTRALGEGMPLRHAAHPYDALVFAGSDPADVYIVDLREAEREVEAMLAKGRAEASLREPIRELAKRLQVRL